MGAAAEAGLITLLAFGLIATSAFAAKVGNGGGHQGGGGGGGGGKHHQQGSSSLALVMVNDVNGDGSANWGDTITFDVSTTETDYPYVSVRCYQDGSLVYSADAGFYDGYMWPGAQLMPLTSPSWTGGAADCSAVLNDTLATLDFQAGA